MNQVPPCDPMFDSRCDLYRSFLRDNNYLQGCPYTANTGTGRPIGRWTQFMSKDEISNTKTQNSRFFERAKKREKAEEARARRRNKVHIYIVYIKRKQISFSFFYSVIAREEWIRGEKELFT